MSPLLKSSFRSEMLYASILLIWPPGLSTLQCSYGRRLIFDYAVDYADATWQLCDRFRGHNCCRSYDIDRASFIIRRFLDIVKDTTYSIFNTSESRHPQIISASNVPSLRLYPDSTLITTAINTITAIQQVLHVLGERFGSYSEIDDNAVLHSLYARRQYRGPPITTATTGSIDIKP
jgi:hypothetical protein